MSNRINNHTLTNDQRVLLNFYLNAYDDIRGDIDRLYDSLDSVVNNINVIYRNAETQRTNNTNAFTHHQYQHQHQHQHQNRPRRYRNTDEIINDYLYNNFSIQNFTRNNIFRNENPRTNPSSSASAQTRHGLNTGIGTGIGIGIGSGSIADNTWNRTNTQLLNFLGQFYNNVPVVPTRQQIDSATRRILYRDIEEPLNSSCPISLDRFQPDDSVTQIMHCGHIFNEESINLWFRANVRCPVCRHDIREPASSIPNTSSVPLTSQRESVVDNENDNENENENEGESDEEEPIDNQDTQATNATIAGAQNVRVERDPTTNSIDRISYDLTDDALINSITSIAGDFLFGNRDRPVQYNSGNQRFVYDPSNNTVMFETYIQRPG